jgi:hypothetical protein
MTQKWTSSPFDDQTHKPELTASSTNRLMLAVLEEALVTFRRGLSSCRAEQRHRSSEVDRWVASKDGDPLFSFESICSSLKIDAGYVRMGLRRLKIDALQGKGVRKPYRLRRERMYDRRAWRGQIR